MLSTNRIKVLIEDLEEVMDDLRMGYDMMIDSRNDEFKILGESSISNEQVIIYEKETMENEENIKTVLRLLNRLIIES